MKKVIIGFGLTLSLVLMVTIGLASVSQLDRSFGIRTESKYSFFSIPNLTMDQSSQICALRQALLKEIEPLQRELVIKNQELNTFESIPDVDRTAVMAKQKEIWQIQSKLHQKIVSFTDEAMKLLTPVQRAELPDFSSGIVGERGFNPIMSKMWGLSTKNQILE